MPQKVKDYFHFNKREREGIIILTILIIATIVVKESFIYFNPELEKDTTNYDSLYARLTDKNRFEEEKSKANNKKLQISPFDPNEMSIEDWGQFGLSVKQASVIKNYQEKAGGFNSKKEVKRLFVISDELYTRLEPFILLPDSIPAPIKKLKRPTKARITSKPRFSRKVYINIADTTELDSLYGIGKVLAKRIVKYRESLGGFVSKSQLNEVYGLSKETLNKLDSQLVLSNAEVNKLNVNQAGVEELKKHPYITWKVANSIVKYREQHGDYKQIGDIKKSKLISDTLYKRLINYLEL